MVGCRQGGDAPSAARSVHDDQRQGLIEANKRAERIEAGDIRNYVRRHGLSGHTSGTGIFWQLLRDVPGDTARPEQWAHVDFRIELLDGTVCYSSDPDDPVAFQVAMDDVESGLHEAIQHLSPGDSAVFILPSYRAHGLIGDLDKVPMRSSVVYHIGLLSVSDKP